MTPTIVFTVGDGWRNDIAWPDGGEISNGDASFGWFSGLRLGSPDGAAVKGNSNPDGLIAHLRTIKGFTVSPVSAVTIGGVVGQQVDVSSNSAEDNWIFLTKISGIGMRPDDKIRMMFFKRNGAVVLLGLESRTAANFDSVVSEAQPILDSIHWM